ncbi:MAG: acetyl-CoA carboxylase biotin carboxyl carrier protein subunit [Anaerolineae bacterium]|nr:MAG: acetyl-CoA carboxylase biotin carboxyl carrier protein subunit [Anaerolineae bacterium]
MKYIATIDDRSFEIDINEQGEIIADGQRLSVDFHSVADQPVYSMLLNGESFEASVSTREMTVEVLLRGRLFLVNVEDERQRRLRETTHMELEQEGEFTLAAPMPGMVVAIPVEVGQSVEKGDNLIILESMKMQNELKAPRDGKVSGVRVSPGDSVDQNQVLLTLI